MLKELLESGPVMRPTHRQWPEFIDEMGGPEGCNFEQKIPGDVQSTTWQCDNTTNRPIARKILASLGFDEAGITRSLEYFDQNGGYCDCEIIFNVAARTATARPQRKNPRRRS